MLATALAFCSVTLTACGSDEESADGLTHITVGVGNNIFDLPLRVAEQKGYFAREGLKVTFVSLTAATVNEALQSESVDFLNDSPNSFYQAVNEDIEQVAVASDGVGSPLGLIVSNEFAHAHGITADTPARKVAKELIGSTAGASSPNTKGQADIYLRSYGVSPKKIRYVTLPSPAANKAALKSHQIDWFVTSEPTPLQVQDSGDGVVAVGPEKVPAWSNEASGYGQLVVTTRKYATSHAATTRKLVTAVQDASRYARHHVGDDDVLDIAAQALPGVPRPVLKKSVALVDWPETGRMSTEGFDTSLGFIRQEGAATAHLKITKDDWTNEYLP
ncbi:ABC transporter substrate-binding protein [Streptomyces sp. NPDC050560]|uniref:ABC transporter substrate-binding protein n=1 Tax=Streptomyces sp. NPDC050560 TaxID=3365630 RepID=UPI00379D5C0B